MFDDRFHTLGNWKFISPDRDGIKTIPRLAEGAGSTSTSGDGSRFGPSLVVEEQFSGFGGHQNHEGRGTMGTHGELFSVTTSSGGLGRTSESSVHVLRRANTTTTDHRRGRFRLEVRLQVPKLACNI